MAGANPFLIRLRGVLRTLDDDALASLANRGLLRRAQKDLEAARPVIVETAADRVRLHVADATVEVPELPSKSTCSCPAAGICRHVLAALLYLRDDPGLAAGAPDPSSGGEHGAALEEVLGSPGDDELQKWAGKALFRKALKSLADQPQVEIETSPALVVRFPARNITCRWIPSGGLAGLTCSCQAETVCEHVVAAVLAYQASLGKRELAAAPSALEESSGAPRTRAEVLASVATVLREIVSLGLVRLSAATAQRLRTLAVSAHGVDLPRLERRLASLADEIQSGLRRDAQSSSADLLLRAAGVEALRLGLERKPAPSLIGQHRTRYHEVGQITLVGLGARHWRSKGGYHGVTVYFWDESRRGWSTWTESRPVGQPGFDPVSRFRAEGPWSGCTSPQEASRSVLRLTGGWRNAQGRLSGRASTRALVIGPSRPDDVRAAVTDWAALVDRAKTLFGGGLEDNVENQDLVLLAPLAWGPGGYDTLRQELLRPVFDVQGRMIDLRLPFTPENEAAIELLERHDPAGTYGVLGALRLVSGRLCVQPISLLGETGIISLNLHAVAAAVAAADAGRRQAPLADAAEEVLAGGDEELDVAVPSAAATPLGRILITAQAELEALAESGIAVRRNPDLLASAARRLEALGLTACSRPLLRLVEAIANRARLAESQPRHEAAAALLHACFVLRLAADQETIATACAGLK